jgi:hypothetical protein
MYVMEEMASTLVDGGSARPRKNEGKNLGWEGEVSQQSRLLLEPRVQLLIHFKHRMNSFV